MSDPPTWTLVLAREGSGYRSSCGRFTLDLAGDPPPVVTAQRVIRGVQIGIPMNMMASGDDDRMIARQLFEESGMAEKVRKGDAITKDMSRWV